MDETNAEQVLSHFLSPPNSVQKMKRYGNRAPKVDECSSLYRAMQQQAFYFSSSKYVHDVQQLKHKKVEGYDRDLREAKFRDLSEVMMHGFGDLRGVRVLPELPSGIYEDLGHNRIKSLVGGNILEMRKDHMTPEFTYNKNFGMEIIDRENWKVNNNRNRTERVTWYTDGSKTQQGTGAGIYNETEKQQYSIPLGKHTSLLWVVGLLTGHCALKGHLHRMGMYNGELKCRLCNRETETAHHILCDCETLDRKRQAIYGHPKLCPEDYSTQPAGKLYKLVQGTRLLEWVV
ncbi:hypothetical protein NQ318_009577 [Aromia moschata]|uniref:Reverse transcriptase zinc-binding domain-containing protein n=1 Tax=Aromia moschata TaxID=1265417 RepID=A0AAV8X396_9CUCU|nr:hypothetical protein NQ318_009577 [Aromia moschata]